jgi:hypothetical protein
MWINKIQETIGLRSDANLNEISESTVKVLQQYKFSTEIKENEIRFQRSIQFTADSGNNRWQVFLYNYKGELEFSESNGVFKEKFSLNINAHLFKSVFEIIMFGLFLYVFKVSLNPLLYLSFSLLFILIQRELIKTHFKNILSQLKN